MTLEVDEEEAFKDPIDYEKVNAEDSGLLLNANRELLSAKNNADRGTMNREMAVAVMTDIKGNLMQIDKHLKQEMTEYDKNAFDKIDEV